MNPLNLTPFEILTYGRAFAVGSALAIKDSDTIRILFKVLNQQMYRPEGEINLNTDCRPYRWGRTRKGAVLPYVAPWARAGVNYVRRTNISQFGPSDWYQTWWDIYNRTIDIDPNATPDEAALADRFGLMFASLADEETLLLNHILDGRLVTERDQIRRLEPLAFEIGETS